jgi:hypothetical protein
MSDVVYVITAKPMNEEMQDQTLYWNVDRYSTHGNGWAPKLSECRSYKDEEKAMEVRDALIERLEKTKYPSEKDINIITVSRKEMMMAKMKGL